MTLWNAAHYDSIPTLNTYSFSSHLFYQAIGSESDKTENGENDEASKQTGQTVPKNYNESVAQQIIVEFIITSQCC